jgi:integrase
MPPERRLVVLLAAFASLRIGEILALTNRRVDLLHGTITVREQVQRSKKAGGVYVAEPKTEAGRRTISIPPQLAAEIEHHLARYAQPGARWLRVPELLRRSRSPRERRSAVAPCPPCCRPRGLALPRPAHTGNNLAAATGASTRELMVRMGHASPRAALIYQHATRERDQAIASALGALIDRESAPPNASVTQLRDTGA